LSHLQSIAQHVNVYVLRWPKIIVDELLVLQHFIVLFKADSAMTELDWSRYGSHLGLKLIYFSHFHCLSADFLRGSEGNFWLK
jgi:hypothetical protein